MQSRRGRPNCTNICCGDGGAPLLDLMYTERGMSTNDIANLLGVSNSHIVKRLHFYEITTKHRGRYLGKAGRPRKSKLWNLTDEELFKTPIDMLVFKYQISHSGVDYARRKRRDQKAIKEADAKPNSVLSIEKRFLPTRH